MLPVELTHQQRELREQFDIKIFVDTDADIRLARRSMRDEQLVISWVSSFNFSVRRDITERGRDIDGVLKQYERFVKPSFDEYTGPVCERGFFKNEYKPNPHFFLSHELSPASLLTSSSLVVAITLVSPFTLAALHSMPSLLTF